MEIKIMAKLEDKQIEADLKDIESKIAGKKSFTREDIQNALDKLHGQKINPDRKKEILKNLVTRTGVKVKGIKNMYTPNEELSIVDKTFGFLDYLNSYPGFIEKEK
jgi:uncharacterized protein Smg (DUF494 family)